MPSSGLYLARELAGRPLHGIIIGTGNARHWLAAPVNRTPFAVVFRPGDAAQAWREIDRFVVLRLDDHLSGGVDQPPLAVLEKGQEAVLEGDADALGTDVDPAFPISRQDRALAVALRHDGGVDIAHDAGTLPHAASSSRPSGGCSGLPSPLK